MGGSFKTTHTFHGSKPGLQLCLLENWRFVMFIQIQDNCGCVGFVNPIARNHVAFGTGAILGTLMINGYAAHSEDYTFLGEVFCVPNHPILCHKRLRWGLSCDPAQDAESDKDRGLIAQLRTLADEVAKCQPLDG